MCGTEDDDNWRKLALLDDNETELAPFEDMTQATEAYAAVFNHGLPIMGITPERQAAAAEAIYGALFDGEPFEDDEAFYEAAGIDPPPDGAII